MHRNSFPIIVRLQGGVGNQLYQYALGRALALRQGRPLLLDPRTILPEAPIRRYALGAFRIKARFLSGSAAFIVRWLGSVRVGRTFRALCPPARSYRYLRDSENGFDASVFETHEGPVVLHGYWQSFRYFLDIAEMLQEELAFTDDPAQESRGVLHRIRSSESVCVHLRRGDYVSNPLFAATLGSCAPEYYERAAGIMAAELRNPSYFVFTDEPDWARRHFRFPAPFMVMDHNPGVADTEDLRLMSNCRHFIIANSSFSWWAAWLAEHAAKRVIAPARWFSEDRTPAADRIPLDWLRI